MYLLANEVECLTTRSTAGPRTRSPTYGRPTSPPPSGPGQRLGPGQRSGPGPRDEGEEKEEDGSGS